MNGKPSPISPSATAVDDTTQPQDASYPEKLKARLDYLEDWYFRPQAYETKISQWEVKELRTHRPHLWKDEEAAEIPQPTATNPQPQTHSPHHSRPTMVTVPSRLGNMSALAGFLNEYFRGQICKQVQSNHISQWSRNNREFLGWVMVDGDKTVPPALCCEIPNTKFYDPQVALEWFAHWILPQLKWRVKGNEEALTHEEKMQRFSERRAQREEDVAEGRFRSVEIFNQHLTAFGLVVNRALNEGEKMMKKVIMAEIAKGLSPAETSNAQPSTLNIEVLEDSVGRGVRAAVDALRASTAKAILEAEETSVLTTDEHL